METDVPTLSFGNRRLLLLRLRLPLKVLDMQKTGAREVEKCKRPHGFRVNAEMPPHPNHYDVLILNLIIMETHGEV